ncbi:MAG TPA: MBL fold metallo-hydrolase [Dehalococcoidia bacterium]
MEQPRAPLVLTFLGSGNAFAPGRFWSGFLLDRRVQFDAPPTLLAQLKRLHLDPAAIDVVFISHFHADHLFGLPFLLLDYDYVTPRRSDLTVVGPPGVEETLRRLMEIGYPGHWGREAGYRLRFLEARPEEAQRAGDLPFRAYRMRHAVGKLECFGFKVEAGGRTLAYSGDTAMCDAIFALAEGADVLVLDCAHAHAGSEEHLGFDEVRELRRRIDPRTVLVLTHLEAAPDVTGMPATLVAEDGATICVAPQGGNR